MLAVDLREVPPLAAVVEVHGLSKLVSLLLLAEASPIMLARLGRLTPAQMVVPVAIRGLGTQSMAPQIAELRVEQAEKVADRSERPYRAEIRLLA